MRRGTPSKIADLSQEVQAKILQLVEAGDKPEVAFGVCGVSRASYYRWLASARDGTDQRAVVFETEIACARDRFKSVARATILAGDEQGVGFGPAKAALEVIGRMFPREWAPKVSVVLEEAESLMLDELQAVCADPDVYARVCEEGNLSAVFVAYCERVARLDSEAEASPLPGSAAGPIH